MGVQKSLQVTSLDGQLDGTKVERDNIKGLIFGGVSTGSYTLGQVKRLTKLSDAEALGLNAAYDSTNLVLVHQQIKEFFRLAPDGVLYIVGLAKATAQATMISTVYQTLIKGTVNAERISTVALKRNPATAYSGTAVNNIWNEITAAITAWQVASAALEAEGYFPGGVILDGSWMGTDYVSQEDLRANNGGEGILCAICQDPNVATLLTEYNRMADVATVLGLMAARKACESLAAPKLEKPNKKWRGGIMSLTDTTFGRWVTARLTNQELTTAISTAQIADLVLKGYTFVAPYGNYKGMFGAGGGTAKELASDYSWIERYEVAQKAKHFAYQFLVPYMNTTIELKAGHLTEEAVAFFEGELTNAVLGVLLKEGNISEYVGVDGAGVFLPNDYNFITGAHDSGDSGLDVDPETLVIQIAVPIKGILRNITLKVGLKA